MNEGQRRYAVEQWMLARVRRGERFDAPGDDDQVDNNDNNDDQDYIDNFDLDLLGSPEAQPEPEPEPEVPNEEEEAAADDFLNQIRDRQEAGPSNMASNSETPMETQSASVSSTPTKRKGTGGGGKSAKVAKSGTSLPGTGGNLDGMVRGGGGGEGGPVAIFRPIGLTHHNMTRTYHKKWRFLTSANANVILAEAASTTNKTPARFAMTTGMASIPWEYLFFYMSPAEYNRMQVAYPGSFAKHASISVKTWNTRVAFQTGDTQTANATLNQNKFLQVAKGFRSIAHIPSSNRQYTFSDTEPMMPTALAAKTSAKYRLELHRAMYGVPSNDKTFKNYPPADATGSEIYLQDYLTIYAPDLTAETTAPPINPGFPPYKNYIEEFDAGQCVNAVVLDMDYDFKYAPLWPNHDAVNNNLTTTTDAAYLTTGTHWEILGQKKVDSSHATLPTQEFLNSGKVYLQQPSADKAYFLEDHQYFQFPMEQGAVFEELHAQSFSDAQQPSCNVGIRAVPKLTTSDNVTQANSWLDAQGYFEVECTLIVESADTFTHIHGNAYVPNTRTQLQKSQTVATGTPKKVAHTYDYPNEYGRMKTIQVEALPTIS